jgi:hypothetical protein
MFGSTSACTGAYGRLKARNTRRRSATSSDDASSSRLEKRCSRVDATAPASMSAGSRPASSIASARTVVARSVASATAATCLVSRCLLSVPTIRMGLPLPILRRLLDLPAALIVSKVASMELGSLAGSLHVCNTGRIDLCHMFLRTRACLHAGARSSDAFDTMLQAPRNGP